MGIPINSLCLECLLKKYLPAARSLGSAESAWEFAQDMLRLILEASPEENSTVLGQRINAVFSQRYNLPADRFIEEKQFSTRFVLQRLDKIRQSVDRSDDPVLTGLQYAIMGNYIDFSALGKNVSFDALEKMLDAPEDFSVDTKAYNSFCQDLSHAKSLLYITDNAGEIGFDWVLADQLQKRYPQLCITFCVRGKPAHNDATREDYAQMGIDYPVIDNGTNIGGTDLNTVNEETRAALISSDVILAKGMGNIETLYGCGYNIYYAFLVKCPRVSEFFGLPMMQSVLLREKSRKE